jgi:Fe-S-cluster containining protein
MDNTSCGGCGKCCEAIWIGLTMEQVKTKIGRIDDAQFILDNWEEITPEEFEKTNPYAAEKYRGRTGLYKCNKFNRETRKCDSYDIRPTLCRNYPFYPESTDNKMIDGELKLHPNFVLYSKDCAFHQAISTKEEWMKDVPKFSEKFLTKSEKE